MHMINMNGYVQSRDQCMLRNKLPPVFLQIAAR